MPEVYIPLLLCAFHDQLYVCYCKIDHEKIDLSKIDSSSIYLSFGEICGTGVDTEAAMTSLRKIPISLHCWQGDDVGGFENHGTGLTGGIAVTGNYPGKARNPDELRADLEKALALILQVAIESTCMLFMASLEARKSIAMRSNRSTFKTGSSGQNSVSSAWISIRRASHPKASDGFTSATPIEGYAISGSSIVLRRARSALRWGKHSALRQSRTSGSQMVTKIAPADRMSPRKRLSESLDKIFATPFNPKHHLDAVECKLFGIGSESYVVGSHEFYLGYAIKKQKLVCLDAGHFHPTESIADKITSTLLYVPRYFFT